MSKKNLLIIPSVVLGAISLLLVKASPNQAENCIPLSVVGGTGTSVTKQVSTPGLVTDNNWNTDFAVPTNQSFSQFIATVKSESSDKGDFQVEMFLKYNNDTADKVFKGTVALPPGESKNLVGNPRKGESPYQVNLKVGSTGTIGFTYTLSVLGCRN
jgi:hypothetical protein